jgi:hypothetical protein
MMRNLFAGAACVALLCSPLALAAEAAAPAGKIVAVKKSMGEKGSFHTVHAKKAKLDCDDCHTTGTLPPDTVMLRLHDTLAKGDPGPVNHETCYDCHSRASKPLPFYVKK